MCGYGVVAKGIEDVAFGSYRSSLDDLFGVAGDEEEGDARLVRGGDGDRGASESERPGCSRVPGDSWRTGVATAGGCRG